MLVSNTCVPDGNDNENLNTYVRKPKLSIRSEDYTETNFLSAYYTALYCRVSQEKFWKYYDK